MADTNHAPAGIGPVEGDGIQYRGIIWFLVIMAVTVLVSAGLMVGTFKWFEREVKLADAPRPPMAQAPGQMPPAPNLLYMSSGTPQVSEPGNLQRFREREEQILKGYTYDKASGVAKIPIERAKELLLQRGLPSRPPAAAEAPPKASPPPAAPAAAPGKAGHND